MPSTPITESIHGVFMQVAGIGLLITGKAGIGKSSLALELLHYDHQLIADDVVDFSTQPNGQVVGFCPDMLYGLLHTRELGALDIKALFGSNAINQSAGLDAIIHLDSSLKNNNTLKANTDFKQICNQPFPRLTISPNNPASLYHRLKVWLKLLTSEAAADEQLKARQQEALLKISR